MFIIKFIVKCFIIFFIFLIRLLNIWITCPHKCYTNFRKINQFLLSFPFFYFSNSPPNHTIPNITIDKILHANSLIRIKHTFCYAVCLVWSLYAKSRFYVFLLVWDYDEFIKPSYVFSCFSSASCILYISFSHYCTVFLCDVYQLKLMPKGQSFNIIDFLLMGCFFGVWEFIRDFLYWIS